jgi:hypothetical protein
MVLDEHRDLLWLVGKKDVESNDIRETFSVSFEVAKKLSVTLNTTVEPHFARAGFFEQIHGVAGGCANVYDTNGPTESPGTRVDQLQERGVEERIVMKNLRIRVPGIY